MLQELARHYSARTSFAFETTLSGRAYQFLIRRRRAAGYRVKLLFLSLASPEEAIARVAEPVIRRGFHAGIANFHTLYAPLVDAWGLYDNSFSEPVVLDWSNR